MGLLACVPVLQAEPKPLIRLDHTSEEVILNNLMSKVPQGAIIRE